MHDLLASRLGHWIGKLGAARKLLPFLAVILLVTASALLLRPDPATAQDVGIQPVEEPQAEPPPAAPNPEPTPPPEPVPPPAPESAPPAPEPAPAPEPPPPEPPPAPPAGEPPAPSPEPTPPAEPDAATEDKEAAPPGAGIQDVSIQEGGAGELSINLTANATAATVQANSLARYLIRVHNNGSRAATYFLAANNSQNAATAALNVTGFSLASGELRTALLEATDETAGTYNVTVNVTASANKTRLFQDGFEAGNFSSSWNVTGPGATNNWTVTNTSPYLGAYHAFVQQTGASTNTTLALNVSTLGYRNILLEYRRKLVGLDAFDNWFVDWYNGTHWITAEEVHDADDATYLARGFSLGASANNKSDFKVRFVCLAGFASESCSLDEVSVSASADTSEVFFDGFETLNLTQNNWTITGGASNSNWTNSTADPFAGTRHARALQTGAGTNSTLQRNISTADYNAITVSYWRKLVGQDATDDWYVDWYNGTAWATLEFVTTANDASYVEKTFTLDASADNNPNFKLRFVCENGAVSEHCNLDNVSVRGVPNDVVYLVVTSTVIAAAPADMNLTANATAATVAANLLAKYAITVHNNGTASATFALAANNSQNAAVATLNETSFVLAVGATRAIQLNVTDEAPGTYNVTVNATAGGTVRQVVFSTTVPPSLAVTALSPAAGSEYLLNGTVNITANVTSDTTIDTVRANVTRPDGTVLVVRLTNASGGITHRTTFNGTNLTQKGRYNITFIANDTAGSVNATSTTWFTRIAPDVIDIIGNDSISLNITIVNNASGKLTFDIKTNHTVFRILVINHSENSPFGVIRLGRNINEKAFPNNGAYYVDVSGLNFTSVNLTANATVGNRLYKCAHFSAENETCQDLCAGGNEDGDCPEQPEGLWTFVMPITPGQNYTVTLTSNTDPGFAEYNLSEAEGENSTNSTVPVNATVLNFTATQAQTLLLGYGELQGTNVLTTIRSQLVLDGTLAGNISWNPDTSRTGNPPGDYLPFFSHQLTNLSLTAHDLALQYATNDSVDTTFIRRARTIALRINDQDAATADSGSAFQGLSPADVAHAVINLSFTPNATQDLLILASAELLPNATNTSINASLHVNGTEVALVEIEGEEDTDIELFATHYLMRDAPAGVLQNFSLRAAGETTANKAVRRARITVIPAGGAFANASETASTTTSATPQNKTVLTFTLASSQDVLIIGTADVRISSPTNGNFIGAALFIDGSPAGNMTIGGSDGTDDFSFIAVRQANLSAGTHTAYIQYWRLGTGGTVTIQRARITAFPSGPGVSITANTTDSATAPNAPARYLLTVRNNGGQASNYTLAVNNSQSAAVASLNATNFTLAAGASRTVLLNVTDETVGTYTVGVNVTESSLGTVQSVVLTAYVNNLPTHDTPLLNSTRGFNTTEDNLTIHPRNATDPDGSPVWNITDWRQNGTSIALLSLPFETLTQNTWTGAIRDYSTYGNNGTLGGGDSAAAPAWNRTSLGGAYVFDGVDDYIQTESGELRTADNFTITVWFRTNDTRFARHILWQGEGDAQGYGASFSEQEMHLSFGTINTSDTAINDTLTFFLGDTDLGDGADADGIIDLTANFTDTRNWTFAAIVIANMSGAPAGALYVNGILAASDTGTLNRTNRTDWNTNLRLGRPGQAQRFFNGTIGEVIIYNRSLTAGQVRALYRDGNASRAPATLVGQELRTGENWTVAVTPNDNRQDGLTRLSNPLIIVSGDTGVNLTANATAATVKESRHARYLLTIHNNGSASGSYTLAVNNSQSAATAVLNETSFTLGAEASRTVLLNVSDETPGTYNVTVNATAGAAVQRLVFSTAVSQAGVNVTANASSAVVPINANASYLIRIHNNGSIDNTYDLRANASGGATAALNVSSIAVPAGAIRTALLLVNHSVQGTYNVTVNGTDPELAIISSRTITTTIAQTAPSVTNIFPAAGTSNLTNVTVPISANVTDDAVSVVRANVSWNNLTASQLVTLTDPDTDNIYTGNFTNTTFNGVYNVTILANDTYGFLNDTGRTWFRLRLQAIVATDLAEYVIGSPVQVTGQRFSENANVTLDIRYPNGTSLTGYPKNVTSNGNGVIADNLTLAATDPAGTYTLIGNDTALSFLDDSTTFTAVAADTITFRLLNTTGQNLNWTILIYNSTGPLDRNCTSPCAYQYNSSALRRIEVDAPGTDHPLNALKYLDFYRTSDTTSYNITIDVPTTAQPIPDNVLNWTEIVAIGTAFTTYSKAIVRISHEAGDGVYKCTDWNFTSLNCTGDWLKLQSTKNPADNTTLTVPQQLMTGNATFAVADEIISLDRIAPTLMAPQKITTAAIRVFNQMDTNVTNLTVTEKIPDEWFGISRLGNVVNTTNGATFSPLTNTITWSPLPLLPRILNGFTYNLLSPQLLANETQAFFYPLNATAKYIFQGQNKTVQLFAGITVTSGGYLTFDELSPEEADALTTATFTLGVDNPGDADVTRANVTLEIPSVCTASAIQDNGTSTDGIIVWNITSLAEDGMVSLDFNLTCTYWSLLTLAARGVGTDANNDTFDNTEFIPLKVTDDVAPSILNVNDTPDPVVGTQRVTIDANVTDAVALESVHARIQAPGRGYTDYLMEAVTGNQSRYVYTPNVTGLHNYTIRARDRGGNQVDSAIFTFNVTGDLIPPAVNLTAPAPGTVILERQGINISAFATDNNPPLASVTARVTLPNGSIIGRAMGGAQQVIEVGRAPINSSWRRINFTSAFVNPVVVAAPITENQPDPAEVRITNVTSTGFSAMVQEPNTLYPNDGIHGSENISYLAVEQGNWTLNGHRIEAHTYTTNTTSSSSGASFDTIAYNRTYTLAPVVVSQVQTFNSAQFVTTAQRGIGTANFDLGLEVSKDGTAHAAETIGWVVWERTSGTLGGISFSAVLSSNTIRGHQNGCYASAHGLGVTPAAVVGRQATRGNSDGGWARHCSDNNAYTSTNTFWEIEEPDNGERSHTQERVNYIAFNATGVIYDVDNNTVHFNDTILLGRYNVTIIANDSSGNVNDTQVTHFNVTNDPSTGPAWSDLNDNETATTPRLNDTTRINVTLTDNTGIDSYTFSTNLTGAWANDTPVDVAGAAMTINITRQVTAAKNSVIGYRFHFNDTGGNRNQTGDGTFTVKDTPPTVPAPDQLPNGTLTTDNTPFLNWTPSTDADGDMITYRTRISNQSDFAVIIQENGTLPAANYTALALADGTYYWHVRAQTADANTSYSENRTFTVDAGAPALTVSQPVNGTTYNATTGLPLEYVAAGASACQYSLDGGANTTLAGCTNTTFNVSTAGTHAITVYANDSVGNVNASTVAFTALFNTTLAVDVSKTLVEVLERYNISALYRYVNGSTVTGATCRVADGTYHRARQDIATLPGTQALHTAAFNIGGNATLRVDIAGLPVNRSHYAVFYREHRHSLVNDSLRAYLRCDGGSTFNTSHLIETLAISNGTTSPAFGVRRIHINASRITSSNCSLLFESINSTNTTSGSWMVADIINASTLQNSYSSTDFGGSWTPRTGRTAFADILWQLEGDDLLMASNGTHYLLQNITHDESQNLTASATCNATLSVTRTASAQQNVTDTAAPQVQINEILPSIPYLNVSNVTVNWQANDLELAESYINLTLPNGSILTFTARPLLLNTSQLTLVGGYDLLAWARDEGNLTSNASKRFYVAYHLPVATYNGSTSNLSNITAQANISGFTLERTGRGRIAWAAVEVARNLNLDLYVNITSNRAYVNSLVLPELNRTANITLEGIGFGDPKPQWDPLDDDSFEDCPGTVCTELGYTAGNFTFNVTRFTAYRAAEGDLTPPTAAYATPTPADGSLTQATITINISHTEANPDKIRLSIDGVLNETRSYSGGSTNFTKTLPDGVHTFNATLNDTAGNTNATVTRTITVDGTPPNITPVGEPTDPSTYTNTSTYNFNATVTDGINVSDVILEFNGVNYSYAAGQLSRTGSTYNRSFSPLAAATYTYRWFANDTVNNRNATAALTFTVDKAVAALFLSFAPNASVNHNATSTVTCTANNPESSPALARNGTSVSNPDTAILAAGSYSYACTSATTQNYTSASQTGTLTVNKGTPALTITLTPGASIAWGTNSTATCSASTGQVTPALARNGTSVGNPHTAFPAAGSYNYSCTSTATENYTAGSAASILTVNKTGNEANLTINGFLNQNRTIPLGNASNASATAATGSATLARNGVSVSNPDAGTLAAGKYEYRASATGNENASSAERIQYLFVKPAITATEFNGSTTNLTLIDDTTNMSPLVLEVAGSGRMVWPVANISSNTNLDAAVDINPNYTRVNSSAVPGLNRTATITLYNLTFTDPAPQWDPEDDGTFTDCPGTVCTELNYTGGHYTFNVTRFTSYSAAEAPAPSPPPPPPAGGGGGGGGGGGTGAAPAVPGTTAGCFESWACIAWTGCTDGTQTRSCEDLNRCGTSLLRPQESRSCSVCTENWACTDWGPCPQDGTRIRFCTDQSRCGTEELKPSESEPCTPPPEPKLPSGAVVVPRAGPNPQYVAPTLLLIVVLISVAILSRREYHSRALRIIVGILHAILILTVGFFAVMMFFESRVTGLAALQEMGGNAFIIGGFILAGIATLIIALVLRHHRKHAARRPKRMLHASRSGVKR